MHLPLSPEITTFAEKKVRTMERILAPSILSADFGFLDRAVRMLNSSRAQWIHIDVMDGLFVPNISFGIPVLGAVTKAANKVIDTHLMIVQPERYVQQFARAGSDYVTFHIEATHNAQRCIDLIHEAGSRAGISIKPATGVWAVEPFLDRIEMVLVMSVEPGFGGQSFMPAMLDKVRELKRLRDERGLNFLIELDGGVSAANAGMIYAAGCDALVAGSAVFGAKDPEFEIVKILDAE